MGPKKAYAAIKEHESLGAALKSLSKDEVSFEPETVADIFLKPNVTDSYSIEWHATNREATVEFLCGEHSFSPDRVNKALDRIEQASKVTEGQKGLESWLG